MPHNTKQRNLRVHTTEIEIDMEENNIQPWDTLQISTAGGMSAVVLHVYGSGNIKVRCPSGHIIVIAPDKVVENYGYVPSEFDRVLRLLIKER